MPSTESSERTAFVDVLYKLAISLASHLDFDELCQKIVSLGCELANTSHAFIYVVNREQEVLELKSGTGIYTYYKGVLRTKTEPSVSSVVWNTGRLLVVGNLRQWGGRAQDRPYGGDIVKSVLGIPLHSGYEVIAVIGIGFETESLELNEAQVDLLSRFATLASLALNNARLYNSLNTELLAQRQINQAQQAILEQQINLYCKELLLAQKKEDELSADQLADHFALVRRMRRTMQMHLTNSYHDAAQIKLEQRPAAAFVEPLTGREQTVLVLMAAGLSNDEIALEMGVTINTVKTHVGHLYNKLGIKRRAQALIRARELSLL